MTRLLIFLILCLSTFAAKAHQPNLASLTLVETEGGNWLIQFNCALSALQGIVDAEYTEEAYASPAEFEALVDSLFRQHLELNIEAARVNLGRIRVSLGHESRILAELINVPTDWKTASIRCSLLEGYSQAQLQFVVRNLQQQLARTTLTKLNAFTAVATRDESRLHAEGMKWAPAAASMYGLGLPIGIGVALGILALSGYLYFRPRRTVH